jgi:acyl carrier protein
MKQIKTALREIFIDTLRLQMSPSQVGEEDLVARLGIDSIALMEIITRVENRFRIVVEDEDVSPTLVNSFDTLARYIAGKTSKGTNDDGNKLPSSGTTLTPSTANDLD